MAKLNFQQPLLQSSVSHASSEIILIYWFISEIILYNIDNCKKKSAIIYLNR